MRHIIIKLLSVFLIGTGLSITFIGFAALRSNEIATLGAFIASVGILMLASVDNDDDHNNSNNTI